jgi:malate synthase
LSPAEQELGIPHGSIRATVLIETILAAFEMDEILYELRDYSAGLNCGRWDYIFSFIKKFGRRADFVLPDRSQVTMERHFLASYVELLIQTCHRRGIHAMGGMAAQIPIKNDPEANARAMERVRADKLREVRAGHDGTWVAHPGLVGLAKDIFDEHMPEPNQIGRERKNVAITAGDLLAVPEGEITQQGLSWNIDVGLQYLNAWLSGNGCVPIYNLMEDAATAEISRAQVWQWVRHGATMAGGGKVTADLVAEITTSLSRKMAGPHADLAAKIFQSLMTSEEFPEFMTSIAYEYLDQTGPRQNG